MVTTVSVYVTLVESGTTVNTYVTMSPRVMATVSALRVALASVMPVSMVTTVLRSVMVADTVLLFTVSVTVVTWGRTASRRAMVTECVLVLAITQVGVDVMPRGEESCARVQVVPARRKTAADKACAMLLTMFATAILAGQVMIAPSLTVLVIRAAVGVASVTSPQTPHDVPAVMLAGMVRVALTRACTALTTRATQSACAMSRVITVTAVTSSAPTWDIVTPMANVCATARLRERTAKYRLALGANSMTACVHPMVCATMIRTTAHVTLDGWVPLVTLAIAQGSLTVMTVATAMSRLIHPAARTV